MKTRQLWAGLLLASGIFTVNAQDVSSTPSLTSGGYGAGSAGVDNAFYGAYAGSYATNNSYRSTFIGAYAGLNTLDSGENVFVGFESGLSNITSSVNTYVGSGSGKNTFNGGGNVFLGYNSGESNTSGKYNVFVGMYSGDITDGLSNTAIGAYAGSGTGSSDNNTTIGYRAGANSYGSNNVFLGTSAGENAYGDSKLFIDNSSTSTPLIWGDFDADQLLLNGIVGVGGVTYFPTTAGGVPLDNYKLFVKGGLLAEEVRVSTTWADYVFADNYALPSLTEVECFITENGHLPNVPSAKQVEAEGISVGEMAKIQQEKIEELTLYIIQQDKQLKTQQGKIEKLEQQEKEISDLKILVQNLIDKKQH